MQPYKPLHNSEAEDQVENGDGVTNIDRQRASAAHTLQMLMLSVFLLLFLGASMFQPHPRPHLLHNSIQNDPKVDCDIQLVESIPIGLNYSDDSPKFLSTFEAWTQLLDSAKETLDIGSFYWTLRGEDTETNHSSTQPGEQIFGRLLANGNEANSKIMIRIAQSEPSKVSPDSDTTKLASNGAADVVSISLPQYFGGGVLHSKLWIVDKQHFYLGSANMDWRSLTQVKEMGILATNCPLLTHDLAAIFKIYWVLGSEKPSKIPDWNDYNVDTRFNLKSPMPLSVNKNTTMTGYISSAPPPLSARGRTHDLDAILNVIDSAISYVNIAVMDYYPLIIYTKKQKYWPYIDNAIRRAAIDRGVAIRMLISWWKHSDPSEDEYLRSLQDLSSPKKSIDIQIRRFIVPTEPDQEGIPYGRVNHNKYMVTDRVAYIGTSNWSGDYFTDTAGIGFVLAETHETEHAKNIRSDLKSVFDRDWSSPYAHELK